MQRFLAAAILVSSVFGSTNPSPKLTSKLVSVGSSYAIEELDVGGHIVGNVIVDTGSSDLVVVACRHSHQNKHCYLTNTSAPVSSLATPCVTLVEDGRDSISYLGCITEEAPVKVFSNAGANAESDPSSTQAAVARSASFLIASSVNLTAKELHPWKEAGGLLGLAGAGLAQYTSSGGDTLFTKLVSNGSSALLSTTSNDEIEYEPREQRRLLAGLDFRAPILEASAESVLHLGGVSSDYPLRWSEPSTEASLDPLGVSTFRSLRLHFPSFCGAPLLGGESSSWPAIIDTGSDCLSLPAEPFDTFLSWAPVAYCGKGGQKGQSNRHLCYVDVSAVQSGLPWISFQATGGGGSAGLVPPNSFTQRSEEGDDLRKQLGRWLHVPLEALLLDAYDSSGRQALCVERGDPIIEPLSSYEAAAASSDGSSVMEDDLAFDDLTTNAPIEAPILAPRYTEPPPPIVLGSLVLRALYVGLDLDKRAVGLSNKLDAPYFKALSEELTHTQAQRRKASSSSHTAGRDGATSTSAAAAAPVVETSKSGDDVIEAPWLTGCAKAVGCVGWEQPSLTGANSCDPPDCDAYFYHVYDEVAGVCVPSPTSRALIGFAVVFLLLMELFAWVTRTRLGDLLARQVGQPPLSRGRGGAWSRVAERSGFTAGWAYAGVCGVWLVDEYLAAKQRRVERSALREQQMQRRLDRLNRRANATPPQRPNLAPNTAGSQPAIDASAETAS